MKIGIKSALRNRNLDLCLAYLATAQTKAELIKVTLENAPVTNGSSDGQES